MTAIHSSRTCRVAGTMWGFLSLPTLPTHILVKRCSPQQLETMCIRAAAHGGRCVVFPVGSCRFLGRILANSFSVPHRLVFIPCKICLEAMCSGCSVCCVGDRLLTSHVQQFLHLLLGLLRRRGGCTSGSPLQISGSFPKKKRERLHLRLPSSHCRGVRCCHQEPQ